MSVASTPDRPFQVAEVSVRIQGWIERLGAIWVEGQVIQFNERPGAYLQYLTLRDLKGTSSLQVSMLNSALKTALVRPAAGEHVLIYCKPDFFVGNGSLTLRATELRPKGIGELLAQIERLKGVLAAEGLFDDVRKRPLPFLPAVIGLVTGRNSDALHDVMHNAQLRWPAVRFEVREVAVQGSSAVREIQAALAELDALGAVEVIVIARGGGGLADLLPFSDEALIRAVAAARTPVVSAIGHERDNPLLDFVADLRASTPTDAAKRVVPDIAEQRRLVTEARAALSRCLRNLIEREQHRLDAIRTRPVLATPVAVVAARERDLAELLARARYRVEAVLLAGAGEVGQLAAQVRALSPAATLDRGYAVVQLADGSVVRTPQQAPPGTQMRLRLAEGALGAVSAGFP